MSKEIAEAFKDAAQACRYYLKHQNFPDWDHADDYQRGVIIACENLETRMLQLAAAEVPNVKVRG